MSFSFSNKSKNLQTKLREFMSDHIYPIEAHYAHQLKNSDNRFSKMPLMDELKNKAKAAGLWNLFVPPEHKEYSPHGGLSFLDYAPLCEEMGRVIWSAEVFNCNAPDTGNMEVFMNFATEKQKTSWLKPLLDGDIRSSYAMTEPHVASSDATNIEMDIKKDGEEWVINGRKWFITGAMNERTKIFIVMGKTDANNQNRGKGFEIAQSRLGPGRMHHCMRLIGSAQRSFELACQRVSSRRTFGRYLSQHQSIREEISKSFSEIEMVRLLVQKTCHHIDTYGVSDSIELIAACKTTVPPLVQTIIDRCMQMHGAGGLTEDYFMAEAFNYARWCRQADGPEQVHQMALGKKLIDKYSNNIE